MKAKVFIAEDERGSLERLKDMLRNFHDIEIIGEAMDGLTAITSIEKEKPDLILLDIQMPGANGFEVLSRLSYEPMVIFITAYDQYAIKAFEANALDYILKPFSQERLNKAILRMLEEKRKITPQVLDQFRELLEKRKYLKRFTVKTGEDMAIIHESEVIFFQAEDKYVFLHTQGQQFFFDMTLKKLETVLDPEIFQRIHKSAIVSLDRIKKVKKRFNGELALLMDDLAKTRLNVSRSYLGQLKKSLKI